MDRQQVRPRLGPRTRDTEDRARWSSNIPAPASTDGFSRYCSGVVQPIGGIINNKRGQRRVPAMVQGLRFLPIRGRSGIRSGSKKVVIFGQVSRQRARFSPWSFSRLRFVFCWRSISRVRVTVEWGGEISVRQRGDEIFLKVGIEGRSCEWDWRE